MIQMSHGPEPHRMVRFVAPIAAGRRIEDVEPRNDRGAAAGVGAR